jgi:YD repeat-containing protein
LTLPNGIVVNYGYDQASQLTGLTYSLAGNVLGNLTYADDADGRRTQMSGSWARTGMPNPTTSTAVYNGGWPRLRRCPSGCPMLVL